MTDAIEKPAFGSPCNGCGVCCRATLCRLARDLLHPTRWEEPEITGPCPMLEEGVGGRSVCGLAVNPASYYPVRAKRAGNATLRHATMMLIGAGIGCDAQNDGEPGDPVFTELLVMHADDRSSQIRFAEEVWGVPHR